MARIEGQVEKEAVESRPRGNMYVDRCLALAPPSELVSFGKEAGVRGGEDRRRQAKHVTHLVRRW